MKNDFDGLISRLDMIEGKNLWARGYNNREALRTERQREQRLEKKEQTIHGLWDNYRRMSIYEMGIHEGEKGGEPKRYLKQMTQTCPKLMSDTKPQIQEAQRTKLYIGISFSNYRN